MVIDSVHYHSKEITSMCEKNKGGRSCVYSASMDGHLRLYEESNGNQGTMTVLCASLTLSFFTNLRSH